MNGFTIENGHASAASGLAGGGISILQASPTITNNIIASNVGCGIFVYNSQASPLIQGNQITGTYVTKITGESSSPCATQSQVDGSVAGLGQGVVLAQVGSVRLINNLIENNVVDPDDHTCGAGVDIAQGVEIVLQSNIIRNNQAFCDAALAMTIGSPPAKLSLIQNLIYGNLDSDGTNFNQVFVTGVYSPPYPSFVEVNNTIVGGGEELVLSFGPSTVANNILENTSTVASDHSIGGLWCADSEAMNSPLTLDHNDILNTGSPVASTCPLGEANLSADPLFVNPADSDFHIQLTSPVAGVGDIDAPQIPLADLDGKARIVCGKTDLAAYEIHPHPPIALTTSQNPAPGGSSLTFTAKLTGNCNTPTGNVTFFDASTAIGKGTLDSSGAARLVTAFLVVGNHNITAVYPGDFNFDSSTSANLVQVITGDPSSTSLQVSPNPAAAFSPIRFTANVTSPYGIPTGSVIFNVNGAPITQASVDVNGRATATISTLVGGKYSITANYTADTRFHASVSPPVEETVIGIGSATTITASPNPALVSQSVAFLVTVKDASNLSNATRPTGTVTLSDNAVVLDSGALDSSGVVVFHVDTFTSGSHFLTANYAGSSTFNSSAATITEIVDPIPATVVLTASPNPANGGQQVTFTANATAAVSGKTVSGVITFVDGSTPLGTSTLNADGSAIFTTSSLSVGTHPIRAILASNSSFAAGTSAVINEVIQAFDFSIQTSPTSLSLPSGDWSVIQVTLTPLGGFNNSVALSCGGLPDHAQCVFQNGVPVSLKNGAQTIPLAINTSDVFGYGKQVSFIPANRRSGRAPLLASLALPVVALLFLRRRSKTSNSWRSRSLPYLGIAAIALSLLLGLEACSGKLPAKVTPGTYPITVIGIDPSETSLHHQAALQLVVTR